MLYPEISSSELIEKLESDDFYKLYGNPVKCKIFDTDRILMSFDLYERLFGKVNLDKENMESEVYDFLNRIILEDYGITLENLTSYFFEWIAACPDEFKAWVEESMMDKGAENDDKWTNF